MFRSGTRRLLGEYTHHYMRQRIVDPALAEARKTPIDRSLAEAVHLDRLDRVQSSNSGHAQMALL